MKKFSGVQFSCHYAFNTNCDFYCKPPMKGGHRHNHIRNAYKRMRKCHICGDPIVLGCEVISDWTNAEFMCRECCRNDAEDYCSAVGIHFGGVTFQTRRRRLEKEKAEFKLKVKKRCAELERI